MAGCCPIRLRIPAFQDGIHRPGVASDATTMRGVFNPHRPRQRKAAVTAGAAWIPADLSLMIRVRPGADPSGPWFGERTAGVRPNRNRTHATHHFRPTPETPRERTRSTRRHRPPGPMPRLRAAIAGLAAERTWMDAARVGICGPSAVGAAAFRAVLDYP